LQLQRAGSDYRVSWDTQAPVVLSAKRGVLVIKDGDFEKELTLNREQLQSSGVVYEPATADVAFRLEVYGTSPEPAIATVRLLAGPKPAAVAEVPVTQTVAPVASAQAVSAPAASASVANNPQPAPPAVEPAAAAPQPASDSPATMAAAPAPGDAPDAAR
jgi:hypothetical protein